MKPSSLFLTVYTAIINYLLSLSQCVRFTTYNSGHIFDHTATIQRYFTSANIDSAYLFTYYKSANWCQSNPRLPLQIIVLSQQFRFQYRFSSISVMKFLAINIFQGWLLAVCNATIDGIDILLSAIEIF